MNKIVELVNTFAKYEEQNPDISIEDFCVQYLTENLALKENQLFEIPINGELGALVGRLGAYAGMYSKKALTKLNLNNVEDWVYLIMLNEMGTPRKSELIYQMLSEFPSGIDVIKRLLNSGFAEEFPDEIDKRSKRVKITPSGLEVVQRGFPEMQKVGEMAFGKLSEVEKQILVNILRKLEHFHDKHYKSIRSAEFEEAFDLLTTH
jgi:MarR family transcriptional regulator, lower aerobic nicotinate degradation pathway regulator